MAVPTAQVQSRWHRSQLAETDASDRASAACYRRTKNIRVVAVIVSELKLRDVQRHIFAADFVERADDAAFEDRPEALDRVGVNRADNVLAAVMAHDAVRIFSGKLAVAAVVIRGNQTDFVRNCLLNEAFQRFRVRSLDHASDHIAAPLDGTNYSCLAGRRTAGAAVATVVAVFVPHLAAHIGFVHFDDAHKLLKFIVLHRGADAVAHVPSRLVGAEAHVAVDLPRANALLAGRHQVDDAEPLPQIDIRVFKNRPDKVRKSVSAALPTSRTFPAVRHGFEAVDVHAPTPGAVDAIGPAVRDKEGVTGFLGRKGCLKLRDGHLHDLPRLFPGHDRNPSASTLESQ